MGDAPGLIREGLEKGELPGRGGSFSTHLLLSHSSTKPLAQLLLSWLRSARQQWHRDKGKKASQGCG